MNEFERGYIEGRRSAQPHWFNADVCLPEKNGVYFVIVEELVDSAYATRGSYSMDFFAMFAEGRWLENEKLRKVRYWAEQTDYDLPEELTGKGAA